MLFDKLNAENAISRKKAGEIQKRFKNGAMEPNFKCEELQDNKITPGRLSKTFRAFLLYKCTYEKFVGDLQENLQTSSKSVQMALQCVLTKFK